MATARVERVSPFTIAMIVIQLAVLGVFLTTFWRVKEIRKSRSGELENGASQ